MSYTVLNAAAFKAQVAAQIARVRKQAENRIAFVMLQAQIHASSISPTYSGDFSENWNVSYGSPDASFKAGPRPFKRTSDGDYMLAPVNSWSGVLGNYNMSGFKLGQPAYLSNAAAHDEPYAWKIEKGAINFRPVNSDKDRVAAKTANKILSILGV